MGADPQPCVKTRGLCPPPASSRIDMAMAAYLVVELAQIHLEDLNSFARSVILQGSGEAILAVCGFKRTKMCGRIA